MFLALVPAQTSLPALVPKPTFMTVGQGTFTLGKDTRISAPRDQKALGEILGGYLRPATGFALPVGGGSGNSINLHLDARLKDLGAEGYRLEITTDRIDIYATKPAGLFYGFQTLRELLPSDIFRPAPVEGESWTIPCVHIKDVPRFSWRGALMDVSRHFETKGFVEKFLDEMALHKLNVLHWHLVDDNGWRIEIKKYPRLTSRGSSTDYSGMNAKGATRSRSDLPGGFYTQEDIKEVVAYAAKRYINILPEIEMPGHSLSAIIAYPELGNRQEIKDAGGDPSSIRGDNVYNVEDSTIQFTKDVIDEVMTLFPFQFVHVGGDEVNKNPWKKNPKAQERMKALDLKNEDELESWFIKQMDGYLTSKGKRLIGWDEILEGGLAPNAAVMSWRGIDGGIAAAKANHDVVMTPTDNLYLDYYQGKDEKQEPPAIGGFVPLSKVYAYEPVPAALTPEQGKHVLGLQGNLWAEFIPDPKHMEYMAFPRLCAVAEIGWSDPRGRSYGEFLTRLEPHLDRLKKMDVAYRELRADDLTP